MNLTYVDFCVSRVVCGPNYANVRTSCASNGQSVVNLSKTDSVRSPRI
jgi:hypothetical protein